MGEGRRMAVRILAAVVAAACLTGVDSSQRPNSRHSHRQVELRVHRPSRRSTRPITAWTFIPEGCLPDCQVQYVFHGVERYGEEYLGNWIASAKARRFMVVVPEFSRRHYPKDTDYSLGRVLNEPDPRKWAFAVPDHLFDHLKARLKLRADTYRAFGHSAGGQFVHRWLLFRPDNRASIIIAANSGWYTMPQWDPEKSTLSFPFSLIGSPIG